jgi:hypothetical protein
MSGRGKGGKGLGKGGAKRHRKVLRDNIQVRCAPLFALLLRVQLFVAVLSLRCASGFLPCQVMACSCCDAYCQLLHSLQSCKVACNTSYRILL